VANLIEDLKSAIPALFDSEEYEERRRVIDEDAERRQHAAFEDVKRRAETDDITLLRTPYGFSFAPVRKGEILTPEAFQELDVGERRRIEEAMPQLQKKLEAVLEQIPKWEKERREALRKLKRELAQTGVGHSFHDTEHTYGDNALLKAYFSALKADIVEHVDLFLQQGQEASASPNEANFASALFSAQRQGELSAAFRRYGVNLIVDNSADGRSARDLEKDGLPVIFEDNPTMSNILGRVEHLPQMGALVTDFMLIKPGALHFANGGYLLIDARRLLAQPLAWEALKRSLRAGEIKIESPGDYLSLISTVSLDPMPIPLNVKVVLLGDRSLYYLLSEFDQEFSELFKIPADFDDIIDREADSDFLYARLIASITKSDGLRPLDRSGVGRVIERSARLAEDAEKLSIVIGPIADLIREADFHAAESGDAIIEARHVDRAIDAQLYRMDRVRERSLETINRDIILIDTEGEKIGQVNALSVTTLGSFSFGRPGRVTARVRMGTGRLIDIERESSLGGPRHSKGVLILSGYLSAHYCPELPLSLSASVVFEQSYGGVDGDSASAAELLALLSALAQVPVRQSLAVTGAVNQHGDIQAIGGVNEKIEGFFDICARRGLTGDQAVVIPAGNLVHLMLRRDVVDAAERGAFSIYAVSTIDECIELLTGLASGKRDIDGNFPKDSFNALVEARLQGFARARHEFAGNGAAGKWRMTLDPRSTEDGEQDPPPSRM
jgi:predicted ATP-dependent protease